MTVLIDHRDPAQIDFVVRRLRESLPVALPTETVYGLAGIATSEKALGQIFHLKNRPQFDPLIVHLLGEEYLGEICEIDFELQKSLCRMFWPGPLTILFRKKKSIPDLCTAGGPWVACRAPKHPVFVKVLEGLRGKVLAAPSANRFASISPTSARDVIRELGPHGLEAVVDGGDCKIGIESTVVKVISESHIEVIRLGAVSVEELRSCVGAKCEIEIRSSGSGVNVAKAMDAPGQMKRHYAPKTSLMFLEDSRDGEIDFSNAALLKICANDPVPTSLDGPWKKTINLSESNDIIEAASALFRTLRQLDDDPAINLIVALPSDEAGIALAIHDRLRRASK